MILLKWKVTQSSIAFNGNPERAVDGNLASVYNQNSCTHTKKQRNPWWRLDLQKTYRINTVTITNRKDFAPIGSMVLRSVLEIPSMPGATLIHLGPPKTFECNGMDGQYVTIVIRGREEYLTLCEVKSPGQKQNKWNIFSSECGIITHTGTSKTFECNGMDGQYVTIVIPGREEYLTLCEVEVTGQPSDWTFKRTYRINTVTITNRKDCCSDRINGAEIRVGNSPNAKGNPNPICAVISSIEAGTSKTFECNGMEGQYVTIVIPGREEYLDTLLDIAKGGKVTQSSIAFNGNPERAVDGNLASVYNQNSCTHTKKQRNPWWRLDLQKTYRINTVTITNRKDCCSDRINGAEIRVGNSLNAKGNPNPILDIAKGGKVTQSSIAFNGNPERAVDGNLASVYNQNSCTHTKKQRNPWWRLDLQKTYRINTVTITNRKDCCSDRINGAEIRVGNSLNAKGNPNTICAVISSIEAGTSKTFECNGMEGQYVTIVIPGREEYLTLCEVEVTGTEAK
ncbi:hypothetical protein F7725_016400 [Dissostichus mawsoni]|uniref:Fucolectin tachylectin-4 pentraxin-1 domain-containing protein n=1 Tax=Dissostichus mawsoni TaxID=36200 RepID=A0A7J5Z4E9_DISMA|nr:hypothetical protein F7725_016400 [Dissostichus mawsoni]